MKLQVLIKEALVVYLLLTHVLHYTALFTCEQGSSTFFDTRDNSRIIISSIIIIIYIYIIYIDNIYINNIYIYIYINTVTESCNFKRVHNFWSKYKWNAEKL